MRRQIFTLGLVALIAVVLAGTVSSLAQERLPEKQPRPDRHELERVMIQRHGEGHGAGQGAGHGIGIGIGGGGDFVYLATEMSFGGKVVKGMPYSAQALTESTQTLSDGNRIINSSTATLYRDSEGRTRREQTLKTIGAMSNAEPSQTVFINDPVSRMNYILETRGKVARKMKQFNFRFDFKTPKPDGVKSEGNSQFEMHVGPEPLIEKGRFESAVAFGWSDKHQRAGKMESLGIQNIGGVNAEGTRTTITIPAGEIGNERPIEIVSERWYSPELQLLVMTRHSDPRFGETVYRLTNIDRSEPAGSLFEVPVDYTVKEEPGFTPGPLRNKKPGGWE